MPVSADLRRAARPRPTTKAALPGLPGSRLKQAFDFAEIEIAGARVKDLEVTPSTVSLDIPPHKTAQGGQQELTRRSFRCVCSTAVQPLCPDAPPTDICGGWRGRSRAHTSFLARADSSAPNWRPPNSSTWSCPPRGCRPSTPTPPGTHDSSSAATPHCCRGHLFGPARRAGRDHSADWAPVQYRRGEVYPTGAAGSRAGIPAQALAAPAISTQAPLVDFSADLPAIEFVPAPLPAEKAIAPADTATQYIVSLPDPTAAQTRRGGGPHRARRVASQMAGHMASASSSGSTPFRRIHLCAAGASLTRRWAWTRRRMSHRRTAPPPLAAPPQHQTEGRRPVPAMELQPRSPSPA